MKTLSKKIRHAVFFLTATLTGFAATQPFQPTSEELGDATEIVETAFGISRDQPRLQILQSGNSGHLNVDLSYVDLPLQIGTQQFAHGLGVHAPSNLQLVLPQPAAHFRASVGYDRNVQTLEGTGGRIIFSVEADGRELWTSAALGVNDPPVPVDLPLGNAKRLNFRVRVDGTDNRNAHGDWADARLEYSDGRSRPLSDFANHSYLIQKLPLSFVLGGQSSRDFLDTWERTVTSEPATDRIRHHLRWRKPDGTFEVRCELVEFLHHPALEWHLFFKNTGAINSAVLEKVLPLDAVISRHRLLSRNSDGERMAVVRAALGSHNEAADFSPAEFTLRRTSSAQFGSSLGHSSDPYLPFWNFDYGGYGFMTALGWSGDWQADVRRLSSMHTGMQAGMANLCLYLEPGEEISSPSICVLFWEGGDALRGTNLFRHYMREMVVPAWNGAPPTSRSMSGGASALETVNEHNQLDFIARIAGTGAQTYWLDAGWYQGPPGARWSKGRGNWFADREKFPHGLKPLADAAHQSGLKFLLWFEPENVEPGTEIAVQHPEWLLRRPTSDYSLFNLGDPAACDFMIKLIGDRLKEWDVDIYRNDFNLDPREFWRRADKPGRTGITELRYVEGFYRFWDALRAARPALLIDNCASGGRRIDYETCKRSVPLWRSDYLCGPESSDQTKSDMYEACQSQNQGLSYFLPYHGNGQNMTFNRYQDRSLVSPSSVLSLYAAAPSGLVDVPHDQVKRVWDDIRSYDSLMACDFYPQIDFSISMRSWLGTQYDRPETGEGCLIVFRRPEAVYTSAEFSLRAIDAHAQYRLTFLNTGEQRTVAASELAHLPVQLGKGESAVILYRRL